MINRMGLRVAHMQVGRAMTAASRTLSRGRLRQRQVATAPIGGVRMLEQSTQSRIATLMASQTHIARTLPIPRVEVSAVVTSALQMIAWTPTHTACAMAAACDHTGGAVTLRRPILREIAMVTAHSTRIARALVAVASLGRPISVGTPSRAEVAENKVVRPSASARSSGAATTTGSIRCGIAMVTVCWTPIVPAGLAVSTAAF
mmetsp:Transcript_84924/g.257689  ORF Transcript_84924/g.257689 Transcript_84924/m.257689 type:complete len:203 (+) Transcript_84924:90-698(+)